MINECGICGTKFDTSTFHNCNRIEGKCKWTFDINFEYWETECNNAQHFEADGIKENNYKFCPFCGKKIQCEEE